MHLQITKPQKKSPDRHSALTFAAFIIGVHRAMSLFTSIASCCGPRMSLSGTSPPSSSKRLRVFSSSSALSRAPLRASRIGCAVPFGANKAHHGDESRFGRPASLVVGTFGRVRSEEHTSELQSHLNLVCRLLLE